MSNKTTQVVPVVPLEDGRDDITVLRNRIVELERQAKSAAYSIQALLEEREEAERKYDALVSGLRNLESHNSMSAEFLAPWYGKRLVCVDDIHALLETNDD